MATFLAENYNIIMHCLLSMATIKQAARWLLYKQKWSYYQTQDNNMQMTSNKDNLHYNISHDAAKKTQEILIKSLWHKSLMCHNQRCIVKSPSCLEQAICERFLRWQFVRTLLFKIMLYYVVIVCENGM